VMLAVWLGPVLASFGAGLGSRAQPQRSPPIKLLVGPEIAQHLFVCLLKCRVSGREMASTHSSGSVLQLWAQASPARPPEDRAFCNWRRQKGYGPAHKAQTVASEIAPLPRGINAVAQLLGVSACLFCFFKSFFFGAGVPAIQLPAADGACC